MELDECVNCGAGLISVSDICPQCGWPKNKPLSNTENEKTEGVKIEEQQDLTEEIVVKKTIFRPTGVRLLGIFQIVFGVLLIGFALFFASMVIFAMINAAIGSVGNMAMFSGISGLDQDSLNSFNSMSGAGAFNMDEMMMIITSTFANASIVIILGIFAIIVGKGLVKGKNWARWLVIVSAIISIPISVSLFGNLDTWTILGSAAFDGLVIYYLTKPKVREYFNQGSIKKSEIKTNKPRSKIEQTIETPSVPDTPSVTEELDSSNIKIRPVGVTILVVLEMLSGIIIIMFVGIVGTIFGAMGIVEGASSMFSAGGIIMGAILSIAITLGVISFVMAWGLWEAKPWAWTWTLIFTIIHLIFDISSTNVLGVVIDAVIFYYLFRPHVKEYFGKSAQQM
jgi:uncharacterized membrane protein (DUF2068 family)